MKKVIRLISLFVVMVTLVTVTVSTNVLAEEFRVSSKSNTYSGDTLVYAGGKYIFGTDNGIYVQSKLGSKPRKITSKVFSKNLISDGKNVYFVVEKNGGAGKIGKAILYSVGVNGKNLKQIKSFSKGGNPGVVGYYNGYIYIRKATNDWLDFGLFSVNVKSGKSEKIKSGTMNEFMYRGRIYFEPQHGDAASYPVYAYDMKTKKISKVLSSGTSVNYCGSGENLALYKYEHKFGKTFKSYQNCYVYTLKSDGKFKKSAKLPAGCQMLYVNSKATYALMGSISNGKTYKVNLKTGSKKVVKGDYSYEITSGITGNDNIYSIVTPFEKDVYVTKFNGNKFVKCKIAGKSEISAAYDYWIHGNKLVQLKNNRLYGYKLTN